MRATRRRRPAASAPALPADMPARVRRIEIQARRLVTGAFLGEYRSVFRGRGIEFAEVRPYDPGDDVRAIDWNVTARMGTPYVRTYVEERELTVLLLVDLSASSAVTTTGVTKRQLAAEVAATLAFAAVASNDRVGLLTFSDRVERYIAPGKGRTHALRLVRELLYEEPAGRGTDLAAALAFLMRVARRRAIVFVLSDFFAPAYERPLRAAAARHDVLALTLGDPAEAALPDAGLLELADAESGARVSIDTADAGARAAYAEAAARRAAGRSRALAAAGIDEVALSTGAPYVEPLLRTFRARERRR